MFVFVFCFFHHKIWQKHAKYSVFVQSAPKCKMKILALVDPSRHSSSSTSASSLRSGLVGPMGSVCLSEIYPYLPVEFWSKEMQMFGIGHHSASLHCSCLRLSIKCLLHVGILGWTQPGYLRVTHTDHPQAWLQGWIPITLILLGCMYISCLSLWSVRSLLTLRDLYPQSCLPRACGGEAGVQFVTKAVVFWSVYIPLLTHGHKLWGVTERISSQGYTAGLVGLLHVIGWWQVGIS